MSQQSLFDSGSSVVKSNRFIQSKIDWTKLEQRIVAIMVSMIDISDDRFRLQRVNVKDVADLIGRSGKSIYQEIESACQSLLDKKFEVRMEEEDGTRSYAGVNLMSGCFYKEGSGYIEAQFTEQMRPLLLQLKRRFTQYDLFTFAQLNSQYSMRIYELLKMREGIHYYRLSVPELREMVGCEDKYSRFTDFERHVIRKSQEELSDKTDIAFTYTVERGKYNRAEHVNFAIQRQHWDSPERCLPFPEASLGNDLGTGTGGEDPDASPPLSPANTSNPPSARSTGNPPSNLYRMTYLNTVEGLSQEDVDAIGSKRIHTVIREAVDEAKTREDSSSKTVVVATAEQIAKRRLGLSESR